MNWVVVVIIVLAVVIVIGVLVRLCLRKKLKNIDGMGGIFTTDKNEESETIIGVCGDGTPGRQK